MQIGFFDISDKYKKLSKLGDPLVEIAKIVDFSIFEDIYHIAYPKRDKPTKKNPRNAGRKPIKPSIIIKIIFLKKLFNLSNEQAEFQITDRHSFQRFVGINANASAPDFTTIWKHENTLSELGLIDRMFERFDAFLAQQGFQAKGGAIIDATIVEVPKQRNTRDENQQIKSGKTPKAFKKNPHQLSQKDMDARWTKKNFINYYGYKDHILIDDKYKLIRFYDVTTANIHDNRPAVDLIKKSEINCLWADSAYQSPDITKVLKDDSIAGYICEKGYKNKPLTKKQIADNHIKSKIRCRVEHVFGFMENSMSSIFIRTIGITRARYQIGLMNLVYNICRFVQLSRIRRCTAG